MVDWALAARPLRSAVFVVVQNFLLLAMPWCVDEVEVRFLSDGIVVPRAPFFSYFFLASAVPL